jgi:hypothetical protein
MLATFTRGMTATVILLLLALLAGCGGTSVTHSSLSTTGNGRQVKASIDGPAWISGNADGSVVTFGSRKLVVEKGRVLLNGKELCKIAEDAKTVAMEFSKGTLTVTVDGVEVYRNHFG